MRLESSRCVGWNGAIVVMVWSSAAAVAEQITVPLAGRASWADRFDASKNGSDGSSAAAAATLGVNFEALPDNNTSIPPHTNGAAGPNHLMTMLNSEVVIQNKNHPLRQNLLQVVGINCSLAHLPSHGDLWLGRLCLPFMNGGVDLPQQLQLGGVITDECLLFIEQTCKSGGRSIIGLQKLFSTRDDEAPLPGLHINNEGQ